MIVMIDNYDSFTYNLVQYLRQLGKEIRVFRNNVFTSTPSVATIWGQGFLLANGVFSTAMEDKFKFYDVTGNHIISTAMDVMDSMTSSVEISNELTRKATELHGELSKFKLS